MILYDTQRSGNAWKVRLLAGFRGIALQRKTLSIAKGDLKSLAFRSISPFAQVPVLDVGGGEHICESVAILYHLAQGSSWWPVDQLAQARVLSWLAFEQDRHMRPLAKLRLHHGLKSEFASSGQELQHWHDSAHASLQLMERTLADRPNGWIASEAQPTIADVALYPYTCMAPMGRIQLGDYPVVQRWLARVEGLSGYQCLFPEMPGSNHRATESWS